MPKASAPKAPWVEVWLSPHTIVSPGKVNPCSGAATCTMPCRGSSRPSSSTPLDPVLARNRSVIAQAPGIGGAVAAGPRGRVMVGKADGQLGGGNARITRSELAKSMVGAHEVPIDQQQVQPVLARQHDVLVPNLPEQRPRRLPLLQIHRSGPYA